MSQAAVRCPPACVQGGNTCGTSGARLNQDPVVLLMACTVVMLAGLLSSRTDVLISTDEALRGKLPVFCKTYGRAGGQRGAAPPPAPPPPPPAARG